jgi:hypothetical protein
MDIRPDLPPEVQPVRLVEPDEDHPKVDPARRMSGVALGLGTASLVIGILAVFFSLSLSLCCFVFPWASVPFSALGLTLGLVGVVVPLATGKRGLLLPTAGACVNALALMIVLVTTVLNVGLLSRRASGPAPGPTPTLHPESRINKPILLDSVTQGDIKVTLVRAEREAGRLVVRLKVENLGKRPVKFRTWSAPEADGAVTLHDEAGNEFALLDAKGDKAVAGQKVAENILPPGGAPLEDVLYFEDPGDFDTVVLELPASHFKDAGRIKFAIRRDKVKD